jgi:hypothetical protein
MHRLTAALVLAASLTGVSSFGALAQSAVPAAAGPPAPPPAAPAPVAAATPATMPCTTPVDPYKNYSCFDTYLGDNVFDRLFNYYKLEWGESGPPTDPSAPPSRRAGWVDAPQSTPPMPFTEWPYGGTTSLGVNRTASVDSPFMVAIANTTVGQLLADAGIQIYGWVNVGGNISSNTLQPAGNAPIAYAYTPNTVQLDQAVIYIERTPDTVQTDHVDWGFRLSGIYGENYRYTTAYGIASYQLLKRNYVNGYDFPMMYGELYIPQVAQGLLIRVGRYISLPDIEAQLAPNNYMYTHSLTYTYDNYTNTGIQGSMAINDHVILQLGVSAGSDTSFLHMGQKTNNPDPNYLYPSSTFLTDPGARPSVTACARFEWNGGRDNLQPCADAINNGVWGYNNLQWYGVTFYHKFSDQWHISYEFYDLHENGVPNLLNPVSQAAVAAGGTPFSPQYLPFNAPNNAICANATVQRCNAYAIGNVAYINYSPDSLNNFSLRPEVYYDPQGQRTGHAATYLALSLGWQHWWSPQLEARPEIGYYRSNGANAFNGGTRDYTVLLAGDLIMHF